jgi:hypothetical protein
LHVGCRPSVTGVHKSTRDIQPNFGCCARRVPHFGSAVPVTRNCRSHREFGAVSAGTEGEMQRQRNEVIRQ